MDLLGHRGHGMVHGSGKTGIHAGHALGAIAAVKAAICFLLSLGLFKSQFHFIKISLTVCQG